MALTKTEIPYLTRVFGAARGCSMGCAYCSTARWSHRLACPKCRTREVHFHEERLGDPAAARKPQVIGVSFYDELWDPLRPKTDVYRVLKACLDAPQHEYVFLTKRPERVTEGMVNLFAARENWWLGVTVDGPDADNVCRLERLRPAMAAGVRTWVSMEPWCMAKAGSLVLEALARVACFVAVGCRSGMDTDPKYDECWHAGVAEIVSWCARGGIPIYIKQAWVNGRCSRDPAEWPEGLRVQELPEAWERIVRSGECGVGSERDTHEAE